MTVTARGPEADLQDRVQAECERLGLLWHHCNDPRRCEGPRGLPDLIIAGPGGLIAAELKSEDGDTTAAQDLWGWTLTRAWKAMGAAGHPSGWTVWRPSHADGTIVRALEEIACAP